MNRDDSVISRAQRAGSPDLPPARRSPAWRAAGYASTLLGVLCLMVAAAGLGGDDAAAHRGRQAAGWVGLGGSAFFLTTGFRLLRERSDGAG